LSGRVSKPCRVLSLVSGLGLSLVVSSSSRAGTQEFADRYRAYQEHVTAGRAALRESDFPLAIDHLTQAIEMSPFESSHYFDRGLAWYRTGQFESAREDFNKAIILDPKRSAAYVYRGLCQMKQGKYHGALSDYTTALSRNPEDATVHNNLAWLYATAEDETFRDPAKALEHAEKAASLSKEANAEILDTLARAYFMNDKIQEAVDAERKAINLDPQNAEFQKHLESYEQALAGSDSRH